MGTEVHYVKTRLGEFEVWQDADLQSEGYWNARDMVTGLTARHVNPKMAMLYVFAQLPLNRSPRKSWRL
jgi:hypothetical protein